MEDLPLLETHEFLGNPARKPGWLNGSVARNGFNIHFEGTGAGNQAVWDAIKVLSLTSGRSICLHRGTLTSALRRWCRDVQ